MQKLHETSIVSQLKLEQNAILPDVWAEFGGKFLFAAIYLLAAPVVSRLPVAATLHVLVFKKNR